MKVLVVDDNPVMRAGLRAMLGTVQQVEEVIEAGDGVQALTAVAASADSPIDLVFLDVRMPGMDGLAVLKELSDIPVVMLTGADDERTIREAMASGAKGYLVNGEYGEAELRAALSMCPKGGKVLSPTASELTSGAPTDPGTRFEFTPRERGLMEALSEGLSNQQIARRLFLSEKTVKNHLNRMYVKMGVGSRAEAIVAWLRG